MKWIVGIPASFAGAIIIIMLLWVLSEFEILRVIFVMSAFVALILAIAPHVGEVIVDRFEDWRRVRRNK